MYEILMNIHIVTKATAGIVLILLQITISSEVVKWMLTCTKYQELRNLDKQKLSSSGEEFCTVNQIAK